MKSQVRCFIRRIGQVMFILWFIGLPSLAPGQEITATFTGPTAPVPAGSRTNLWLNVLNSSSQEVSWSFSQKIEGRVISSQGASDVSLELQNPAEAGEVKIAPGAFARREYSLIIPVSASGQVVVAFPQMNANRVVLDAQASPPVTGTTEENEEPVFARWIEHAEPKEPGKPFVPGWFFKEHISGYEPFYFIAGTKSPNAKFQISFMYQLLNNEGSLATNVPALRGFHIAYTQTSLWDWNAPSAPFFDTSYKPEFLYAWDRAAGGRSNDWYQLDLQGGLRHESNGKGGADSRSLNIAYLQPKLSLGRDDRLQLTLQPRAWVYLGDLSDNPDIADYRGYADLRAVVGWQRGLQLSALGRMGKDADHGGLQLDLTYPMMKIFGSFSLYLDAQYFTGYGESLLEYNQRSEAFRAGFAIYR
jgi:outer membrane phospholipase A